MSATKPASNKVTIKIPRVLYDRLSVIVSDSGFNSVTDFIIYILRDLVSTRPELRSQKTKNGDNLTKEEIDAIRKRLRSLGYL